MAGGTADAALPYEQIRNPIGTGLFEKLRFSRTFF